jgi:hypothetical protein
MLTDRLIPLRSQRQPTLHKMTARQTRLDASLANGGTLQDNQSYEVQQKEEISSSIGKSYGNLFYTLLKAKLSAYPPAKSCLLRSAWVSTSGDDPECCRERSFDWDYFIPFQQYLQQLCEPLRRRTYHNRPAVWYSSRSVNPECIGTKEIAPCS